MRCVSLLLFLFVFPQSGICQLRKPSKKFNEPDRLKALAYLRTIDTLQTSKHWPYVNPKRFLANLKSNIENPYTFSTGRGTYFCAFGAVSYTCLKNEPYRYAVCMAELYKNGKAQYRNVLIVPSESVKAAAGNMRYQGDLDINHADQIWFLSLADRFKGYVNIFNKKYNSGDENTLWAATNLSKFNRMLRRMCKYKVYSRGSDFIRPLIKDKYEFIKQRMAEGEVYLYINNTVFRKKNHNMTQLIVPTHFIVITDLNKKANGDVVVKYWDGSYKTQKETSMKALRKIIYGISWVKFGEKN
jgi:hypothetical protein